MLRSGLGVLAGLSIVGALTAPVEAVPAPTSLRVISAPTVGVANLAVAPAPSRERRSVREVRVLGTSVQGRKIRAFRLGQRATTRRETVVLISTMHGNESATGQILRALKNAPPIYGVDLWVVPTYNPDGEARGTRPNARGVDLNRNYPNNWVDLDGNYESGAEPASEPETKAMMTFLRDVKPDRILSFHQPLYGVDVDTKRPGFARKVARKLRLPRSSFTCGGVCHGTMTGWYNNNFAGNALTVEYGARPGRRQMRTKAPVQVLSIFGAHIDSARIVE